MKERYDITDMVAKEKLETGTAYQAGVEFYGRKKREVIEAIVSENPLTEFGFITLIEKTELFDLKLEQLHRRHKMGLLK